MNDNTFFSYIVIIIRDNIYGNNYTHSYQLSLPISKKCSIYYVLTGKNTMNIIVRIT